MSVIYNMSCDVMSFQSTSYKILQIYHVLQMFVKSFVQHDLSISLSQLKNLMGFRLVSVMGVKDTVISSPVSNRILISRLKS